jgi:hypothetical protein
MVFGKLEEYRKKCRVLKIGFIETLIETRQSLMRAPTIVFPKSPPCGIPYYYDCANRVDGIHGKRRGHFSNWHKE